MVLSCEIITRNEFILEKGSHPSDSIIVVLEGSFSCQTRGKNYVVSENEIFFFKRADIFKRKIITPIKGIYIIFDDLPFFENQKFSTKNITRTRENIAFLLNATLSDNKKYVSHFVDDLIYLYADENKTIDKNTSAITKYIQENFKSNLTLDELSKEFKISKQWLIRTFKEETGTTPIVYLNNFRMKKAKELLMQSELSIGEIATECGFETQYYFSNCFKKTFGMSPSVWRSNMLL